jgi:hypothetical protein
VTAFDQDERDRAAWALCCDDMNKTPRVNPRQVWPRVETEYRHKATLALAASQNPEAPLPPDWDTTNNHHQEEKDVPAQTTMNITGETA